jgi:2-isopropylmalate synthase
LVDASFNALLALTGVSAKLIRYNVSSLTAGSDAQGEGYCVLETESGIVAGHGTDINTVQAGVKAMIDALNKLVHREGN